jgi:hypothetical protein
VSAVVAVGSQGVFNMFDYSKEHSLGTITLYPEIAPLNLLLFKKYNIKLGNYRSYNWPSDPPVEAFKADTFGNEEDLEQVFNGKNGIYEFLLNRIFSDDFTSENAVSKLEELSLEVKNGLHLLL